ncbi:MAG: cation-translocating P-type ATPase [Saprospiraceae bacterium]|nr:cation-translocating P-type ATPase [Saprospiraceae bacterium]
MHIKYPFKNPHTLSVTEVLLAFEVDKHEGLTISKSTHRNSQFGLNSFILKPPKSLWLVLLKQFQSLIVYLLAFAALVSLYFNDVIEAVAIAIVLLINALIGFFLEMQSRKSMNALKKMDVITCRVIRDGKLHEINAEKIAPGDIVDLTSGDVIPADGRLVESNILQCDESSLTGESIPTLKNIETLPEKTTLGDQVNMVFKGASVMSGHGTVVITGIGKDTELGKITSLVENAVSTETPLDKKLVALSKKLIWVTLFMTAIFAVTGFIQGKHWLLILETSIALAVAAFPEGLPIVATIALSYGMLLMAKRGAIVKNLSAVETLGSTNVILTDKTGTLTENVIQVDTFSFPDETVRVSIENQSLKFDDGDIIHSHHNFELLKIVAALCNNASFSMASKKEKAIGDPVEISLLRLANTSGLSYHDVQKKYKRVGEIPFDAVSKMMATIHKNDKVSFIAAKGAAEHLLEKCSHIQYGDHQQKLTATDKKKILETSDNMSQNGLKVLAFAYQEAPGLNENDFLKELVYIGLIGFLDPPRLDIKKAITTCRNAGIKVVMITGDHPHTALNIAEKVGLVDDMDQEVISGKDLPDIKSLTKVWKNKILATSVFARTTPKQKLDIAEIFQQAGNIVAMTGDGVNDAPALKKADVGIAMGKRGTQVAKESANIVLKNDSFSSIAEAVGHGREIFNNIKKFVIYLVSCNLSEIFIVTALGFYAPASTMLPLQILFLNIVTDVFPALALGLGKGDKTVMTRPPRSPKEDIITHQEWIRIGWYAFIITISVVLAVVCCKLFLSPDHKIINSVAFVTLAFAQLFHVFNMSSPKSKLFSNEVTRNHFVWYALILCTALILLVFMVPYMRLALGLTIMTSDVWMVAIAASLIPLVVIQMYKFFSNFVSKIK